MSSYFKWRISSYNFRTPAISSYKHNVSTYRPCSRAPEIADSPPPSHLGSLSPPPTSPSPTEFFSYPPLPPPPPDSSSTLPDSPPPPPGLRTADSPPSRSSIIDAVLHNGQYCLSPNLGSSLYIVFALLGVPLY
ncbi:hypothetical protein KP509_05G033500 [Ceratopteris richardii]|uniref:Uncharacterized protein n=1 Tax=Ceratopteris richardii TaxID=49495 RepID=A0A8T2UTJ8_CERRI|nr:hypothetical protein KP509_05G033500 [Ceratopteris richardii]